MNGTLCSLPFLAVYLVWVTSADRQPSYGYNNDLSDDKGYGINIEDENPLADKEHSFEAEYSDASRAREWLHNFSKQQQSRKQEVALASWHYLTDMTPKNKEKLDKLSIETKDWKNEQRKIAKKFYMDTFEDNLRRQFKLHFTTASSNDPEVRKKLTLLESELEHLYANAKACYGGTCLDKGEQAPSDVMRASRDFDELAKVWNAWREATGTKKVKTIWREVTELRNKGARENGYPDIGYFEWKEDFENAYFNQEVTRLYVDLKPLYEQLHAYVRGRLVKQYPGRFENRGPIPAHILGNLWGQQWQNIFDIVAPKAQPKKDDINERLRTFSANKTAAVVNMFKLAEEFFVSLGLFPMVNTFWTKSMLTKPPDVTVQCHASAHDLRSGNDFRIKMCTNTTKNDLVVIHHEMGHVEYYMSYRRLPAAYHGGANSGFHEAIGDTIALSAGTPKHMKKLGLLDGIKETNEDHINYLMYMALQKIAFIPFAYLTDNWRWMVYNGTIKPSEYSTKWWEMVKKYQGLMPPSKPKADNFEPAAKYHVAVNVPYIRYFTSYIMQFQFYKAMCDAAGFKGPLYQCDFYKSKKAGKKLKKMLQMGKSEPWPIAMQVLTGKPQIDTGPLKEFFKPLIEWLMKVNEKQRNPIGW